MKKLFILLMALSFAACSPAKRLDRLLDRHPQLKSIDTAIIHHTTTIPELQFRNRFTMAPIDSLEFRDGKTRIRIARNNDSIFLEIHRPEEKIREIIKIPVEVIRHETPSVSYMFWKRFPWLVVALVFILASINWLFSKK